MCYGEDMAIPVVSNLVSVSRHQETKTNEGSHIVFITETVAHQHAQNAIRHSQVIQGDLPIAFPVDRHS